MIQNDFPIYVYTYVKFRMMCNIFAEHSFAIFNYEEQES